MRITYEAEVTEVTKTKYTDSGYRSETSWQSGRYTREAIVVPLRLELGAKVRVIVTDEPEAEETAAESAGLIAVAL